MKGRKHTDEAKRKISESKIGKKRPQHVIDSMTRANTKVILQFSHTGKLLREYQSIKQAVEKTGVSERTIIRGLQCPNAYTTFRGYVWRYKSKYTVEQIFEFTKEL